MSPPAPQGEAPWQRNGARRPRVGTSGVIPPHGGRSPAGRTRNFAGGVGQPGLDLLRAVAVVVVVIYHAGIFGFRLPHDLHRFGWVGVDLFFVLSGYLIGGQLLGALASGHPVVLGRFYARRALRILPASFLVLAVYFFWPGLREFPQISPFWKFLFSVQNLGLQSGTAFSHAWSLAVEDQFYLLLPWCCFSTGAGAGVGLGPPSLGVYFLGGWVCVRCLTSSSTSPMRARLTGSSCRGFITRPGPGSIHSSSGSCWPPWKSIGRPGGGGSAIVPRGSGCRRLPAGCAWGKAISPWPRASGNFCWLPSAWLRCSFVRSARGFRFGGSTCRVRRSSRASLTAFTSTINSLFTG